MANDESVVYESDGGVARIILNRPEKRNALNERVIAGLKEGLQQAHGNPEVKAILLTGAGADFCSGADLAALQRIATASVEENLTDARSLMELFLLIRSVRPPVIAAVKGRALAGGCGLATACDIVLASQSSRFGYPEVKIGFVPAMVMAILRRNVSEKRAFELITLGGEIGAVEAAQIGLVNQVFADESFEDEVDAYAKRFMKISSPAIALTKRLLYQTEAMSFADALQFGVDENVIARMSEDCKKGVERFLKRA
jgi:methylglutaconyl-CoA hydratase